MGIELAFSGSQDLILWVEIYHFYGQTSIRLSKDLILRLAKCHFVGIKIKDCIVIVKDLIPKSSKRPQRTTDLEELHDFKDLKDL